jgi:type IV pilus assembly protein PilW
MKLNSHPLRVRRLHAARGFSFVEILVGIAIGLVGMLVIFRTVGVWDTQTRSTTTNSDAQSSGNLAMFAIERDVKQAGQGLTGIGTEIPRGLGCNVVGARNFRLAPVEIVQGVPAGAPDRLQVLYGNSAFFVSEESFTASTLTTKVTVRRNGFKTGDLAVAADPANCVLLQVTDDTNGDGRTLDHASSGTYLNYYAGPPASAVPAFNSAAVPALASGKLYSLGPLPRHNTWDVIVNRSVLRNTELFSGQVFEAAEGIVNMQAEYGLDNSALRDRRVDVWSTVTPVTPEEWARVVAIRVGLLTRGRQFEKAADQTNEAEAAAAVTTVNPAWAGGNFVMTNVDGTADMGMTPPDPNNWRYYRYRVYEKTISLRNVIWGTGPGSASITPP